MAPQDFHHHKVRIIEQCEVSPPDGFIPTFSSIPVSFFDIPWVYCVPVQSIFFYEFPHSTNHFMHKVLPNLKHSLSLTLQHFFPMASNLVFPPQPNHPHFLYSSGDSITLSIAESTQNLHHLISDSPRDVRDLYPFVPTLPPPQISSSDGTTSFPLMAIQITILPNSGFSICLTFRHIVADAKSFIHFMKFWACVCRSTMIVGENKKFILPPSPLFSRDTIKDPKGLKLIYLKDLWNNLSQNSLQFNDPVHNFVDNNNVRLTLILCRDHIEKLKKCVHVKCNNLGLESESLHISSFVVACSLIWVCLVESEVTDTVNIPNNKNNELYHLTFLADCRNRFGLSIPTTYFGNCLVRRIVSLEKNKLVGDNGIAEAAIAIGRKVEDVKNDAMNGVESFVEVNKELETAKNRLIKIGGSPKIGVYDTDFGWGKPIKSEILHIEYAGSISLSDSRYNDDGVEVGLVLDRAQANNFNSILKEYLQNAAC